MFTPLGCGTLLHPLTCTITAPADGSDGGSARDERRLLKTAPAARFFQVHTATIEGWLSKAYIRAYRLEGSGPILFDVDEIERALKLYGPTKMRDGRRRGAKGRVVSLAIVSEAVDE